MCEDTDVWLVWGWQGLLCGWSTDEQTERRAGEKLSGAGAGVTTLPGIN